MMRHTRTWMALAFLSGALVACDTGTGPGSLAEFDAEAALEDYRTLDRVLGSEGWKGFLAMGGAVSMETFGPAVEIALSAPRDLRGLRDGRGARALATTMAANGAHTALVSGGFTLFTSVVAQRAGFAENRANILEQSGDELTGAVREPILGREAKRQALEGMASQRAIPLDLTLAVGDGANDLAMIERAGLGAAYRAKPVVAAAADAAIDHADLTALLYAQGYREAEISG